VRFILFLLAFSMEIRVRAATASEFFAAPDAVVRWSHDHARVTVAKGLVRVGRAGELDVETLFAKFGRSEGAQYILRVEADQVRVVSLSGTLRYQPRGRSDWMSLPAGFEQVIGRVDSTGEARTRIPTPAKNLSVFLDWTQLLKRTDLAEFRSIWPQFAESKRLAADGAGRQTASLIENLIADEQARKDRLEETRLRAERERLYFREMFRRRNFIDPGLQ
jgi:hypothetical protein